MIERRAMARHNVVRAGTVQFDGGAANCTIRNISRIGAALDLQSEAIVPHEIDLVMADGRVSQHCYVVWRREKRIGIMFDPSGR
jgi:hypothetical protein